MRHLRYCENLKHKQLSLKRVSL